MSHANKQHVKLCLHCTRTRNAQMPPGSDFSSSSQHHCPLRWLHRQRTLAPKPVPNSLGTAAERCSCSQLLHQKSRKRLPLARLGGHKVIPEPVTVAKEVRWCDWSDATRVPTLELQGGVSLTSTVYRPGNGEDSCIPLAWAPPQGDPKTRISSASRFFGR